MWTAIIKTSFPCSLTRCSERFISLCFTVSLFFAFRLEGVLWAKWKSVSSLVKKMFPAWECFGTKLFLVCIPYSFQHWILCLRIISHLLLDDFFAVSILVNHLFLILIILHLNYCYLLLNLQGSSIFPNSSACFSIVRIGFFHLTFIFSLDAFFVFQWFWDSCSKVYYMLIIYFIISNKRKSCYRESRLFFLLWNAFHRILMKPQPND